MPRRSKHVLLLWHNKDVKIAVDRPLQQQGPQRGIYKRQTARKGGTQSYGPSRQRLQVSAVKGKPGAILGRKATDLSCSESSLGPFELNAKNKT